MGASDSSTGLQSCLYSGQVQHERLIPFRHAFKYRLFQVYLDLSELDRVFRGRWLWSIGKFSVAQFRREDHLGDSRQPLDEAVRQLVNQHRGVRPSGPIRLLTHLRYFGFVMNPVSFYYCFDHGDQNVEFVVAEVNNTPWGEQHCYVLDWRQDGDRQTLTARQEKEFHVSPFMPMNMEYRWKLTAPGETLNIRIENFQQETQAFRASLNLRREPLTTWSMTKFLLWRPCMTGIVFVAIYWQALKLWWKGATYFPHPPPQQQPV